MKFVKLTLASLLIAFAMNTSAQKIKLKDGSLDVLKTEAAFNFEFTYDNMGVGKFEKEADYVKKKTDEYNAKDAGRGDSWAKKWVNDRADQYEPKFRELFNRFAESTTKKDAKYTIIFHTIFTEPGYNIAGGMMIGGRKNAQIDAEVTIVETADRSKKVAVLSLDNAPGGTAFGNDYDSATRISEAYAKAGKSLAKYIK